MNSLIPPARPRGEMPALDLDTNKVVHVVIEHALNSIYSIELTIDKTTVQLDHRLFMMEFNRMLMMWGRSPYVQAKPYLDPPTTRAEGKGTPPEDVEI